jgi:threonylcarbamoyladenosine tRNA methylthiotransferase MtaB
MGCAAARAPEAIAELPGVRAVVPGGDVERVASALGLPSGPFPQRTRRQRTVRAVLRIQDGCDEHCTFCATRLARGRNRSRPTAELEAEARALGRRHPEVVLTGVHVGAWGHDLGSTLGALLERLVAAVPDVRFRLSSLEATEVDDRVADLLTGDARRLAPHLHAPLQSGSDRLLRRMGRHWYDAARYARAVERLAVRGTPFGLGADVITGFPGETPADHAATVALVRSLPFTYLHVFPWSPRPGTAAERMSPMVPPALARERAAELRAIAQCKGDAYRRSRAGGRADVVVVGDGARREGLTEDYLTVSLAQSVPRGARFDARLEPGAGGALLARGHGNNACTVPG